ncbi:hypothetical protein [Paenibacillus kandeliae]|uniref:hypothetical protein n=1 Tax=Paenibacillus kandeliae TaxID=3231269 RepID=UPI00345986C9
MGSRMMHYCIAALIESRLGWHDRQFMLGNLAPDVVEYAVNDRSKRRSHFIRLDSTGEGFFDLERFAATYLREQRSLFHIGYYFHLLTDDLWIKKIYAPYISKLPPEDRQEAKEKYERDLCRLDSQLPAYYGIVYTPLNDEVLAMPEADLKLLPLLVSDLEHKWIDTDDTSAPLESLELLQWDKVTAVLEETVQACLTQLRMWEEADQMFFRHGYRQTLEGNL